MAKLLTSIKRNGNTILLALALLALAIQTAKNVFRNGDFIGYVQAGALALNKQDIYSDYLNTWPPFFSMVAMPLTLLDEVNPALVRLLWLLGSLAVLFLCMRWFYELILEKRLLLPFAKVKSATDLEFANKLVLIPFLLSLRFFLDNSSHLQINIYMLAMALGSIYFYQKNKLWAAAILLGFSISIKIFTVFILLYFIYKKAYKISAYTLAVIAVCVTSTFVFYGFDLAVAYHHHWFTACVMPLPTGHHMNQSLLALFVRLFTDAPTGINSSISISIIEAGMLKKIYYLTLAIGAAYPLYMFFGAMQKRAFTVAQALQWSVVFAVIPLLSPVAWKPYFVFLWMPIVVIYLILFYQKNSTSPNKSKGIIALFVAAMILLIGSAEIFAGPRLSDVLEVHGVMTIGTLLIIFCLILIYVGLSESEREQPVGLFMNKNT